MPEGETERSPEGGHRWERDPPRAGKTVVWVMRVERSADAIIGRAEAAQSMLEEGLERERQRGLIQSEPESAPPEPE